MSQIQIESGGRLEFAARRRTAQDDAIAVLRPVVRAWIEAGMVDDAELREALVDLYMGTYIAEGGRRRGRTPGFLQSLRPALRKTTDQSDPQTVATWLAVAAINAASAQSADDDPEPLLLEWVTMHDSKVRHEHAEANGQRRPPGSRFLVGGEWMRYPGDSHASPDLWINCRCVIRPLLLSEDFSASLTSSVPKEKTMPLDTPLTWHGVLVPEEEWSGDGRRFTSGALRNRDLPLPLTWQKATSEGHDGSVVVGRIDVIERVDNMIRGEGVFIDTPETDEVVGLIAEFGRFGVSIDADDSEFEFNEETSQVTFTSARIASASLVSIPAFASASITFGTWAEEDVPFPPEEDKECDPSSPDYEECLAQKAREEGEVSQAASLGTNDSVVTLISEESWDGSAGRFSPEQWKAACILHVCDGMEKSCHKLPIKEPGGALSRAGVHAAAARFNQVDAPPEEKAKAAAKLRGAYKQLGEEAPDVIKASLETDDEFYGRGPGWITNPEDTRRIWSYWTQPGHEGYAKINWGVPGDFNRCRAMVGEKIAANSPEDLRFLNQICAVWHHDATGFWPGRAPTELRDLSGESVAPAISLVASGATKAPAAWFADPKLTGPTHLTVTEEGRVFGHIAEWSSCHVGYPDVCVAPPPSSSNYSYFATGQVLLDDDTSARTGVISLGGGHAGGRLSPRMAAAHYDSTSAAVADVTVGEDEHGIWCAGWVRPGTDENAVTALRASDISGDWREISGNLELIAALACNVAGFPVAAVQDKVQVALVASGVIEQGDDPMATVVTAVVAALGRRDRMAQLRERVGAR